MTVSLNTLDLNLLRVFDALIDERNVLRAGQRVGLSQSAVSHSLSRLREVLDDDLFVRTAAGMQPTARALAMAAHVREALVQVDLALASGSFDPGASHRRFTLAASDSITLVLVPEMQRLLTTEAPHVDVVIRPGTRIDLAEQIDLGRIDLAVGSYAAVPKRLKSTRLYDETDVLAANRDGAYGTRGIGIEDLANAPIVAVSLGGQEEGARKGFISERGLARRSEMFDREALEKALAAAGATPRLAVVLPHFLAIPGLLAHTDAVAIVPLPLARLFEASGGLVVHPTPYETTPVAVRTVWHERNDGDAAHTWFRRLLIRAAAAATARR